MDTSRSARNQFSNIYDKYVDKIYRFVFLKVSSEDVARDITSETFTRGWEFFTKSIDSKDKIKNPQAFLYKVARNLIIDHYRKRTRVQTISTQEFLIPDPGVDLEQTSAMSSDLEEIKQHIAKLGNDYQDVIILRYIEGLSFRQISHISGRKEATLRVMLHRALKELRESLEQNP